MNPIHYSMFCTINHLRVFIHLLNGHSSLLNIEDDVIIYFFISQHTMSIIGKKANQVLYSTSAPSLPYSV